MQYGGNGWMLMAVLFPAAFTWACGDGISSGECYSAEYPTLCAGRSGAPSRCWSVDTICSTVVRCPDGTDQACADAEQHFDCNARTCVLNISASTCTDPERPVFCPALGSVPASCWKPGTVCSTVVRCSDGTDQACAESTQHFDCDSRACVPNVTSEACNSPAYPIFCPAFDGVPAFCWAPGTVCSTIVQCPDGTYQGCTDASRWVNCATRTCVGTRSRVRGACIRQLSSGPYSSSCCPDVAKEECLVESGMQSFVPDAGLDYCQMHGYGDNCGACCYKATF